jgi:hypothetical protein
MRRTTKSATAFAVAAAVVVAAVALIVNPVGANPAHRKKPPQVHLRLTPSSATLASCMPKAKVKIDLHLTTDKVGFDRLKITATHLRRYTAFTVFLLEQAGPPFGAAEYIGDVITNKHGNAETTLRLIVEEAFSSTLVNGQRVRVDLNRVGMWFADPPDDDFCIHDSPETVTPFDGDNEAGVQAFNSANAAPLPAP